MKRLIVYAGANGAGKSTLRDAGADPVEVEIDADRIARQLSPGNPRAADTAAAREALQLFDRAIREGRSLSFETTLSGRTVLRRIRVAKRVGYEVALRYVALNDTEENVRRVEQRAAGGEHWIEPDVVRRRALGSLANLRLPSRSPTGRCCSITPDAPTGSCLESRAVASCSRLRTCRDGFANCCPVSQTRLCRSSF